MSTTTAAPVNTPTDIVEQQRVIYAQQIEQEKQRSRTQFEADLAAQRQQAVTSFQSSLSAAVASGKRVSVLDLIPVAKQFSAELAGWQYIQRMHYNAAVARGETVVPKEQFEAELQAKSKEATTAFQQNLQQQISSQRVSVLDLIPAAKQFGQRLEATQFWETVRYNTSVKNWEKEQWTAFDTWKQTVPAQLEQANFDAQKAALLSFYEQYPDWYAAEITKLKAQTAPSTTLSPNPPTRSAPTGNLTDIDPALQDWYKERILGIEPPHGLFSELSKLIPSSGIGAYAKPALTVIQKSINVATEGWQKPPSLSAQLFGQSNVVPQIIQPKGIGSYKFTSGATASFESFIYGGAEILGAHHPATPASTTGSILGYAFGSDAGIKELQQKGWLYTIGSLAGDVALSMMVGKAVEPITKSVTHEIGLAWRGSDTEMWLMEHSDWYAQRVARNIAPEIVSTPTPSLPSSQGGVLSMADVRAYEKFAQYENYFWNNPAPRTSELAINRYAGASTRIQNWVRESWVKRVTGGLSYALVQEELERQTVKPSIPYIPAVEALHSGEGFLDLAIGFTVTSLPPYKMDTTSTLKPAVMEYLKPSTGVKSVQIIKPEIAVAQTERLKAFVVPKLDMDLGVDLEASPITTQMTVPSQVTKTMQVVEQIPTLEVPTIQTQFQPPSFEPKYGFPVPELPRMGGFDWKPEGKKRKRKQARLGVGHVLRKYPVTTPKEFQKIMLTGRKKK